METTICSYLLRKNALRIIPIKHIGKTDTNVHIITSKKIIMKKKLAIIGTSYLQRTLVEKCKELGVYSICFAWEDGTVCRDLCDKFYPISTVDKKVKQIICQEKK